MTREAIACTGAAAIAAALVALAFLVAPRACAGGLALYLASGGVALVLLFGLPYFARIGLTIPARTAYALGFVALGAAAWFGGLFLANVKFVCGMGYL